MSDVRLTATNPEDSSVVPVACNAKGQLLLEDPLTVEGPEGPRGPEGPKGDDGEDGAPGDSFVPDPSTGADGSVLITNGTTCFWGESPSIFGDWYLTVVSSQSTYSVSQASVKGMFDGNPGTNVSFQQYSNGRPGCVHTFVAFMAVTSIEIRMANDGTVPLSVELNGKQEVIDATKDEWTLAPRFTQEQVVSGTTLSINAISASNLRMSGLRINGVELLDAQTFNQVQQFSFEQYVRTNGDRLKQMLGL